MCVQPIFTDISAGLAQRLLLRAGLNSAGPGESAAPNHRERVFPRFGSASDGSFAATDAENFASLNPPNFFAELKRRNVYKVAVAYAIVSWLLIQIATQVFPFFEIPNWAVRLVVLLLIIGFPVALVLAWAFEITPEGIKRADEVAPGQSISHNTGRKLIGISVALAVVAAGMFAARQYQAQSRKGIACRRRVTNSHDDRGGDGCRGVDSGEEHRSSSF